MLSKITHNFCNRSNFCIFFTYKYNMKKKCYIKKEKNFKKRCNISAIAGTIRQITVKYEIKTHNIRNRAVRCKNRNDKTA